MTADAFTETFMSATLGPLPDGTYPVRVTEAERRVTSALGLDYVRLRLEVEEPEHAGRIVWAVLAPRNPFLWQELTALGVAGDLALFGITPEPDAVTPLNEEWICDVIADLVVGARTLARIRTREWRGEPRNWVVRLR